MNLRQYYEETTKQENELIETRKRLEEQITAYHDLRGICTHSIIFKFKDNYPTDRPVDGNYFCPACRLVIECASKEQLKNTKYRESRVIPLLNLSLRNGRVVHDAIREEVFQNLDLYYNPEASIEELSAKMEDAIAEHHFDYLNPNKVLRK